LRVCFSLLLLVTFLLIFTKFLTEFLSDLLQEIILEFSEAKTPVMVKPLSVFAKDAHQFARVAQHHVSGHEGNLESKYMLSACSINCAAQNSTTLTALYHYMMNSH
jgi:hypothetical protein